MSWAFWWSTFDALYCITSSSVETTLHARRAAVKEQKTEWGIENGKRKRYAVRRSRQPRMTQILVAGAISAPWWRWQRKELFESWNNVDFFYSRCFVTLEGTLFHIAYFDRPLPFLMMVMSPLQAALRWDCFHRQVELQIVQYTSSFVLHADARQQRHIGAQSKK